MHHIFEHMTTVKWHHWNQVGETEEYVDPHDPKHEIDEEQETLLTNQICEPRIIRFEHGLFVRMHCYTLQLEWNEHRCNNLERSDEDTLRNRVIGVWRKWSSETIDAFCIFCKTFNSQECVAWFD